MKKFTTLATYFSLFILLCSFVTTPLIAFSETLDDPNTPQTVLQKDTQIQNATPTVQENPPSVVSQEDAQSVVAPELENVADVAADTGDSSVYTSQISDADKTEPSYFGGSIITLYNGITVSGNTASLDEGAYTVISLAKASFDKPLAENVSSSFAAFKSIEIKETETEWQIVTIYKTLIGGYSADTPFKIFLTSGQVINGSKHDVKQEFYTVDNQLLSKSDYTLTGKSVIEMPFPVNYNVERLTTQVDGNYIIKEGQTFTFDTSNLGYPPSNQSDPRDRRIIATVPEGTKVKAGTGWTKVADTDNQYFKDVTRDQFTTASVSLLLDLSGIDLSVNDDNSKPKAFRVDFSVQPVVAGVIQTDIPTQTWYVQRNYYILKNDAVDPDKDVKSGIYTTNEFNFLDDTYTKSKYEASLYVSNNTSNLNIKGRQTQQVVNKHFMNNQKSDKDPVNFVIKTSRIDVSKYLNPTQFKIDVTGLSTEDSANLISKLKGTKVYGEKTYNGPRVLLSDDITVENTENISGTYNKKGWINFAPGDYQSIIFEYPDTLAFDKDEYDKDLFKSLYVSVVGDVRNNISDDLEKLLPNAPRINQNDYVQTDVEVYVHLNAESDVVDKIDTHASDFARETYLLQYDAIQNYSSTAITNGEGFYTGDTVAVRVGYSHTRNGNMVAGVTPQNLNIYYLVPDGLEPVDNPAVFESIKVIPAYQPGYNLVIVKPKSLAVPNDLDIITQTTSELYTLNFKVNVRLAIGSYAIRSAIAIDNNEYNAAVGASSGIIQTNVPSGVWENITTNAENRSENPNRFTDLSSATLNIYPNRILVAYKSVKLASESDDNYAYSLGLKGKINSEINYQLKLINNSLRDITGITLFDVMPYQGDKSIVPNENGDYVSRGSLFSTPLTGPVTSDIFDIYYTTDTPKETLEETKNMNWVSSVDDYSKVTAIKADMKPGQVIKAEGEANIVLNSRIENSLSIADGAKAFNSFAYSLNDGLSYVEALSAEVPVNYDKKDITLNKIDRFNPEITLANAVFDLYEKDSGKKIQENIETDEVGQAILKNLIIGRVYYLKEVSAPEGYNKLESLIEFTVTEDVNEISVDNVKNEDITLSGRKIW